MRLWAWIFWNGGGCNNLDLYQIIVSYIYIRSTTFSAVVSAHGVFVELYAPQGEVLVWFSFVMIFFLNKIGGLVDFTCIHSWTYWFITVWSCAHNCKLIWSLLLSILALSLNWHMRSLLFIGFSLGLGKRWTFTWANQWACNTSVTVFCIIFWM